jgi:hypothetical protein
VFFVYNEGMNNAPQALQTCTQIFDYISPYAGGSVPSDDSKQYANWMRWLQTKQDEYARRGYWKRLLTKATITAAAEAETAVLPDDFHRANGLYVFKVADEYGNETDWAEEGVNKLFVTMITDDTDEDYGQWQIEFIEPLTSAISATAWYFKNPPIPTVGSDKVILPGDLLAYGVLSEYFRSTGAEGSQDDARVEAENRFQSYLTQENIPARYELLQFNSKPRKIFNIWDRRLYSSRLDRQSN